MKNRHLSYKSDMNYMYKSIIYLETLYTMEMWNLFDVI